MRVLIVFLITCIFLYQKLCIIIKFGEIKFLLWKILGTYNRQQMSPQTDNELLEVRDWVLTIQSSLYLQVLNTMPSIW